MTRLTCRSSIPLSLIISLILGLGFGARADTELRDGEPGVVLIQPILTRGNDGQAPANCRIQEALIDGLYATADVDFYFLEPVYWDSSTAREGSIDVGRVVGNAIEQGVYRGNGRVSNVLFVDGINGRPGPAGLARQPGWQVFVAMVDPDKADSDAQDAFVVAHECGHNLGLGHAVDDPRVPNDTPNVMGNGPYIQRVGPNGINDFQVSVIRSNPLTVARIRCLDVDTATQLIIDESFEPYFSQLQPREIEAFTAQPVERHDLELARAVARQRFQEMARGFSDREAEALSALADRIDGLLAEDMPLFTEMPWAFIKVDDALCGGFAHTRAECIIFSEQIVSMIATEYHDNGPDQALLRFGPLLVHEQLHVLQRMHPLRFARLYQDVWGFVQADVQSLENLTTNQVTNPDAIRSDWLIPGEDVDGATHYLWPRTLLKETPGVPRMGRDFEAVMIEVVEDTEGRFVVATDADGNPRMGPLEDYADYLGRFPVRNGHDHPNEIAAYLFEEMILADYLRPAISIAAEIDEAMEAALDPFRTWCWSSYSIWPIACVSLAG